MTAGHKLVHFGSPRYPPLLYDLAADPGETTNVAADPRYAQLLVACMAEMLRWRARHLEHSMAHLGVGAPAGVGGAPAPAAPPAEPKPPPKLPLVPDGDPRGALGSPPDDADSGDCVHKRSQRRHYKNLCVERGVSVG